jgi:allantoin racemase
MRILVINPNTSDSMTRAIGETARQCANPGTDVDTVCATRGPRSIDGHVDHYLSAVGVLERIAMTQGEYDGYVIACFGDPALNAAREMVDVPVVGMAEAAMHMACMLGDKFSIVSTLDRARPMIEELVSRYGLVTKCASIRTTGLAVLELEEDPALTALHLEKQGRVAVEVDGAETLILGCAGLVGFDKSLGDAVGVPVIDGVVCGVKIVESFVECGLATSKVSMFKSTDRKEVIGYDGVFDRIYK